MSIIDVNPATLTDDQFDRISVLVKRLCGINLHVGKKELVKARLGKRLRQLGFSDFDEYTDYVRRDRTGKELTAMLDALSTNLTHFFREPAHFEYLTERLLPRLKAAGNKAGRRLRVWSAGCSSGEEPYSIAICLRQCILDIDRWDVGILATDLSTRMLGDAKKGHYSAERVRGVPPMLIPKYFARVGPRGQQEFEVRDDLRRLIVFARLNLTGHWPMRGPFDVIFCRNVMIYFEKPIQAMLIQRFWDLLPWSGTLFIGHSEGLTGVKHRFRYVRPAIYEKS